MQKNRFLRYMTGTGILLLILIISCGLSVLISLTEAGIYAQFFVIVLCSSLAGKTVRLFFFGKGSGKELMPATGMTITVYLISVSIVTLAITLLWKSVLN